MFGNLFGKKSSAQHQDDQVWKTAAACVHRLCDEAVSRAAAGRSVLVICLTNAAFDMVDARLATHQPAHCRDLFGRDTLRAALARPGAITIALSGSLPAETVAASVPVQIMVFGRNASRAADETLARFADHLGAQAALVFYLSMDDALLQPFAHSILPLLERLGINDSEALSHPLVTRAIRNSQSP